MICEGFLAVFLYYYQWCDQDSAFQDQDQDSTFLDQDSIFRDQDQDTTFRDQDQNTKNLSRDVSRPRQCLETSQFPSLIITQK